MAPGVDLRLGSRVDLLRNVLSWTPRAIRSADQQCIDALVTCTTPDEVTTGNFSFISGLDNSEDQLLILNYLCRANAPALAAALATTHFMKHEVSLAVLRTISRICEHLCRHDVMRDIHDRILGATRGKASAEDIIRLSDMYLAKGEFEAARSLADTLQGDRGRALRNRLRVALHLHQERHHFAGTYYVVNLPSDTHRRYRSEYRAQMLNCPIEIVRALRPEMIDESYHHLFSTSLDNKTDGSFGNQFTQYKLWRAIASGTCEYSFVTEDDAWLLGPIPDPITALNVPDDFDIVFVNDRLCPMTYDVDAENVSSSCPISLALGLIAAVFPDINALGSDGYFVSRRGAEKLVAIVEQNGFRAVGTDWLLVSHCVTPADIDSLPSGSNLHTILSQRLRRHALPMTHLRAFVSVLPVVRHLPFNVSRANRI